MMRKKELFRRCDNHADLAFSDSTLISADLCSIRRLANANAAQVPIPSVSCALNHKDDLPVSRGGAKVPVGLYLG